MAPTLLPGLQDIAQLEPGDIAARATSYWDASPLQAAAVYLPRSTEEVSRILKACHAADQTIVVQGGRTGCAAGADSTGTDVAISLERMNRIERIDADAMTAEVEAGVILETLQNAAAERDLFLPLDLGARGSCTIGGNIATNAGGVNVIRYGMVRNLVLGLEAVLPDGRIVSSMQPMLKNNSGYDLKQLFIGTEGTIGIVTRAILRLEPAVAGHATALAALSSFEAVAALLRLSKARLGADLTSFELMWGAYYAAVSDGLGVRPPTPVGYDYYALIETECRDQEAGRDALVALFEEAIATGRIDDGVLAQSEKERREMWRIRDDFEPILRKKPVYLFDVSMGVAAMEGYVATARDLLSTAFPESEFHVFGHIGDGNLHLFVYPGQGPAALGAGTRREVERCVYEPLQSVNGSISAEHGIGREKKPWLGVTRSDTEIAVMKTLKRAFDPKNLLNPGVIFDL
ncbi:MAG: FAD-binding oxidoreductase [Pseudomonadota bacterium]